MKKSNLPDLGEELDREEKESEEATVELLSIPGFPEAFERAEQEIRAGHLIPLEQLRRKA